MGRYYAFHQGVAVNSNAKTAAQRHDRRCGHDTALRSIRSGNARLRLLPQSGLAANVSQAHKKKMAKWVWQGWVACRYRPTRKNRSLQKVCRFAPPDFEPFFNAVSASVIVVQGSY